ncbi:hypothetical protein QQP08_012861 [Theobroma cacao]|nr:hypothetical protein QQP08_012861 [Theobroma cacao]
MEYFQEAIGAIPGCAKLGVELENDGLLVGKDGWLVAEGDVAGSVKLGILSGEDGREEAIGAIPCCVKPDVELDEDGLGNDGWVVSEGDVAGSVKLGSLPGADG